MWTSPPMRVGAPLVVYFWLARLRFFHSLSLSQPTMSWDKEKSMWLPNAMRCVYSRIALIIPLSTFALSRLFSIHGEVSLWGKAHLWAFLCTYLQYVCPYSSRRRYIRCWSTCWLLVYIFCPEDKLLRGITSSFYRGRRESNFQQRIYLALAHKTQNLQVNTYLHTQSKYIHTLTVDWDVIGGDSLHRLCSYAVNV